MYKPILFNTDMVKSIRAGFKTCTRRIVKDMPESVHCVLGEGDKDRTLEFMYGCQTPDGTFHDMYFAAKAPFWPGDVLWVRETWNYGYIETADQVGAYQQWFEENDPKSPGTYLAALSRYFYRADMAENECNEYGMIWKPSIFMPRAAARIFLRVTDVRAERLQDITSDSIDAEGCKEYAYDAQTGEFLPSSPIWFKIVWDGTVSKASLSKYGWDANPWVWVIEFERCEKPENWENEN